VEKLIADTDVETDTDDDTDREVAKYIKTSEAADIELVSWMDDRIGKMDAEVPRVEEAMLLLGCNI
jgi:hypothetical protein